jgi:hypothetical protein
MLWWWALGVPTLAFPMPAYLEAARRARYAPDLVSLLTPEHVTTALCAQRESRTRTHSLHTRACASSAFGPLARRRRCAVRSATSRKCLQRAAIRGARGASPQASVFELLAAVCHVRRQRVRWERSLISTERSARVL